MLKRFRKYDTHALIVWVSELIVVSIATIAGFISSLHLMLNVADRLGILDLMYDAKYDVYDGSIIFIFIALFCGAKCHNLAKRVFNWLGQHISFH